MLKKIAQILALAVPLALVGCGGGSSSGSTTTTPASYTGNYVGNVTGVNAGPANFNVDAAGKVTGKFSITNRAADCAARGGVCETDVTGTVDGSGKFKGDFVDSGQATMSVSGQLTGSTMTGSWFEYCCSAVTGNFSVTK